MDTSQWHQELGLVKPMGNSSNNITTSSINNTSNMNISAVRPQQLMVERRGRPQKEQALNCPRCKSNNTKFCYYNNYSLTQPRYFCKACRRYWTEGGTLRNVPVGGSSRKNKKVPPSSSASSRLSTPVTTTPKRNPNQELNLGSSANSTVVNGSTNNAMSAMDLLKSAGAGGMMMNPFMGMPVVQEYPLGFGLHDFGANALNFPLEGGGGGSVEEGASGRMLFPFEEIRQASSSNTNHVNVNNASDHGDDRFEQQKGFWNGMNIGGVGGGGGGGSW